MRRLLTVLVVAAVATSCASAKPTADDAAETDDAKMHSPPSGAESDPKTPRSPPLVRSGDAEGTGEATAGTDTEDREGEPAGERITRSELGAFLDRGPSYVLTVVSVEPVHRDGFQGYQIVDVTRGVRDFMMPQLRVGDVVTHVNGVKLERPEDYMQAWRSLDKVTTIRIDFTRQNEPMNAVWVVE